MLHATSASSMRNSSCSVNDARVEVDARLSIASVFFKNSKGHLHYSIRIWVLCMFMFTSCPKWSMVLYIRTHPGAKRQSCEEPAQQVQPPSVWREQEVGNVCQAGISARLDSTGVRFLDSSRRSLRGEKTPRALQVRPEKRGRLRIWGTYWQTSPARLISWALKKESNRSQSNELCNKRWRVRARLYRSQLLILSFAAFFISARVTHFCTFWSAPLQIQNVREGAQLLRQRVNKYLPHVGKFDGYSSDVGHILWKCCQCFANVCDSLTCLTNFTYWQ